MRAYRKTTQHPFCVYLTAEEALALMNESRNATTGDKPVLCKVGDKLGDLIADPKRERA